MWPRIVEVMLGCWLALSPFIFRHVAEQRALWFNDLFCAAAVVVIALLSDWPPCRRAHLAIIGVGLWLVGFGYLGSPHPTPPALQNSVLVGALLLMFAIIPSEASLPPRSWRDYFAANPETPT
jgi:MFS family permease